MTEIHEARMPLGPPASSMALWTISFSDLHAEAGDQSSKPYPVLPAAALNTI